MGERRTKVLIRESEGGKWVRRGGSTKQRIRLA